MLYLFDLDGTIISSYMDEPNRNYHAWQVLPGRGKTLHRMIADGHQVAIITNQAGVAFGFTTEDDFCRKIAAVATQLEFPAVDVFDGRLDGELALGWGSPRLAVYVCYADSRARTPEGRHGHERRKPSGAMIREALANAGTTTALMVGDRYEDQQAAADAGVAFRWAEEFFG